MNSALLTERAFAEMIADNGGRVFRVGGCVRDKFMGVTPKDIDYCIVGMVKRNFKIIFPDAEEYGKSFPVFRLEIDGAKCELAFARTERKVGSGYKGFKISSKPKVTIEEDLFRRDTTVNSIAMDCLTGEIIDPFNGVKDINDKVLKATSLHFPDDPMRALRLAGQSARLGFRIDGDTLILASTVADELKNEPAERMLIELTKVLAEAQQPAVFFKALAQADLLKITFREISQLSKGDFETAMVRLDAVAKLTQKSKLRFATFGLVLNKEAIAQWNNIMTLPGDWFDSAVAIGKITAILQSPSPEKIVTAISSLRRGALSCEEFDIIATGAGLHIPALSPFKAIIALSQGNSVPETVKGKDIGEWLRIKHIEMISKLL
ncbi:MAG: polynucleotide adenylyltransferase [Sporomusaceae bacterium]|nr:polynucleotide adenylyltransferase [Sporomusaceae bacterium]